MLRGEVHIVVLCEIALHRVHHHVGHAGGRLVGRQGERAAGVHDGKLRAREVVRVAELHVAVLVGDDRRLAHLAAGGGDGQHTGHGQHLRRRGFAKIEVPDVALVGYAVADALGRVDDAAATDGEQEVDALLAAQLDTLLSQRQTRIGHHAAERNVLYPTLAEQRTDLIEQPRLQGTLSAVMHQHLRATVFLH